MTFNVMRKHFYYYYYYKNLLIELLEAKLLEKRLNFDFRLPEKRKKNSIKTILKYFLTTFFLSTEE
jgi:hypothetical protein